MMREAGASPFSPASLALGALMMLLLGVNLGKLLGADSGENTQGTRRLVPTGLTQTPLAANRNPVVSSSDSNITNSPRTHPCKQGGSAKTESWEQLSERLMQPLRVHGPDGKIAADASRWYGDAREAMPEGLSKQAADRWRRFPGPDSSFYPASRDAAIKDPRGKLATGEDAVNPLITNCGSVRLGVHSLVLSS